MSPTNKHIQKTSFVRPDMTIASPFFSVPPLSFGKLFFRLARQWIACQIYSGRSDEESAKILSYLRDKFERLLQDEGIKEGWPLLIRGKTRNLVTTDKRDELEEFVQALLKTPSPAGPIERIFSAHKPGEELSHGQLSDLIRGNINNGTSFATTLINDLVSLGVLTKLKSNYNATRYRLNDCAVMLAPCRQFLEDEVSRIARKIYYPATDYDRHYGWTVDLCESGMRDLHCYLRSKEIEDHLRLTRGHAGEEPNFGVLVTASPLIKTETWALGAERTINDRESVRASERVMVLSLADLDDKRRNHYSTTGQSEARDDLTKVTRSFVARKIKDRRFLQRHGLSFSYSPILLD